MTGAANVGRTPEARPDDQPRKERGRRGGADSLPLVPPIEKVVKHWSRPF